MTDNTAFDEKLHQLSSRKRFVNAVSGACRGLFLAATLSAILAIAKFVVGFDLGWLAVGILVLGGVVAGAAVGFFLPVDGLRAARSLDAAADASDRFASALQLRGTASQSRAGLVLNDAMARVEGVTTTKAIPICLPREAKLVPIPLVALLVAMLISPIGSVQADSVQRDISPEEWRDISSEFREEISDIDQEDEPLIDQLERLAELLEQNPDKKLALAELAKLREDIDRRRRSLDLGDVSPKEAARKMRQSEELSEAAKAMQAGDYAKTSDELQMLAEQLKENSLSMDASAFEAAASDLEMLSEQLKDAQALREALEQAADASRSMNREELAKALERLAEQMRKNKDKLEENDRLAKARRALDKLKKRMGRPKPGECQSCQGKGCADCAGSGQAGGDGKQGGLKPGWGSEQDWSGGQAPREAQDTEVDLAMLQETAGFSDMLSAMSADEDMLSGQGFEEQMAEMIRRAEADLDLESAPLAYREYLRSYFVSLRSELDVDQAEEQEVGQE